VEKFCHTFKTASQFQHCHAIDKWLKKWLKSLWHFYCFRWNRPAVYSLSTKFYFTIRQI